VPPALRTLDELTNNAEPAIDSLRAWVREAENPCELLPPSERRADILLTLQVTTRSTLGALAYDTGGLVIDGGWLRILGSGHEHLPRDLQSWNEARAHGIYLVADDAVGGFFALNGGTFGPDLHHVYYWPPDTLEWEPCGVGMTDFLRWALTARLEAFYENVRWPTWRQDIAGLSRDRCFSFHPFLWTKEGSVQRSRRAAVPVAEAFDTKVAVTRRP
jgi:hypothetical protein